MSFPIPLFFRYHLPLIKDWFMLSKATIAYLLSFCPIDFCLSAGYFEILSLFHTPCYAHNVAYFLLVIIFRFLSFLFFQLCEHLFEYISTQFPPPSSTSVRERWVRFQSFGFWLFLSNFNTFFPHPLL